MLQLLSEINATAAALGALVATITPLALKFWSAISGTRMDIRTLLEAQVQMNASQQSMLEGQQSMLTAQQGMITSQQTEITRLSAEIENLSAAMAVLTKFVENRNEDEFFKTKIINIGDSVVLANSNLHPDFIALLLEGTKAASGFFVELSKKLDRDPRLIEAEAMQILKSLRASTTGSDFINKDFRDKIRDRVGRPMVRKLITQLQLLKNGNYNGQTRTRYEGIVLSWVLEFLQEAVRV